MTPPPPWLCVHEAAHAVAHCVINSRLPKAETIIRNVTVKDSSGNVTVRIRKDCDPRNQAICCLAGYAAEMVHRHGQAWWPVDGQLTDVPAIVPDVEMARDAVAALPWPEAEMLDAWAAAHDLVMEHWPALVHVARVLQSRLSMSGGEFEAVWRGGTAFVGVVL